MYDEFYQGFSNNDTSDVLDESLSDAGHKATKGADVDSASKGDVQGQFPTNMQYESQSFLNITPLHPTIPYYLSFYHLDSIRRLRLASARPDPHVTELSCHGTSTLYRVGPSYTWSSHIYFDGSKFWHKQEIIYNLQVPCESQKFNVCLHLLLTIGKPKVVSRKGRAQWRCRVQLPYPRSRV